MEISRLRLTFLGGFHVADDQRSITRFGGDKVRALFAYLAVEAERPHARTALAALLWPDLPDEFALRNLAQSLVRLRTALGDAALSVLTITRQAIQWRAEIEVDVTTFMRLARSQSLADLEAAAALYGGEFLPGFGLEDCEVFEEWLLLTRERLHQQALATYERLADLHSAAARHKQALEAARHQLALDPWRETAYRQMMRALAATGDRAGALAAYERCRQVLHDELGAAPDRETAALAAQIRQDQGDPAAAFALAAALPAPLTALVGREGDLAAVTDLVRRGARLVTVLGPGGVGKTRLALAAAHNLREQFPDGVWWIELAGVRNTGDRATQGDQLIAVILDAFTNRQRSQRPPLDELCEVIRGRTLLLVLDNCEHLSAAGAMIHALLIDSPTLRVLATSRERLGVYGEEPLLLDGLPVSATGADDAQHAAAVQLFLTRARQQVRGFGSDPQMLEAVVRLCQLLEGMPLGIELAAHWVGDYTPDEIATAVRDDLTFLETRDHYGPDRHRSLRAVFGYSWGLLTSEERRILAGVSVFAGGFDRTAALQVAEARPATLAVLVDKSLLRRISAGRYSMHELLRQFSAEQLDGAGDARSAVEARHSAFYLTFVAVREQRMMRDQPREAVAEIHVELDNVRQAWTWATTHAGVIDLEKGVGSLWQFFWVTGQTVESERAFAFACRQLGAVVQHAPDDSDMWRVWSIMLALYATSLTVGGKHDQAIIVAQQALALQQIDSEGQTIAAFAWGRALYRKAERLEARIQMNHALHLAQVQQRVNAASELVQFIEWNAHLWLRAIDISLSDYDRARHHALEALQLCQAQDRRLGEVHSLWNLADVEREVYDLPTARIHYDRALQLMPAVLSRPAEGVIGLELSDVVRLQGQYTYACDLIERALRVFRETGDIAYECLAIAFMARVSACMGDIVHAPEWFARFTILKHSIKAPEMQATALLAITAYAHSIGDYPQALAYAEQCKELTHAFSHAYAQAHSLVALGHARAALHQSNADVAYQQALDVYAAVHNPGLGTEVWAGLAALSLAQGDLPQARTYVEVVLQAIADQQRIGLDEPFDVYLICYRVLNATDDPRAENVLQTAHAELLQWTAAISDPHDRQRFVQNVASHRELSALATREIERTIAR